MKSGIYLLKIGRRRYVGQARNLVTRWSRHTAELRANKHHNYQLQNEYNAGNRPKYSVLTYCPIWQLDALEAIWGRVCSNTKQRLPRLRPASFLPACHWHTLAQWLTGLFAADLLRIWWPIISDVLRS